MHAYTVRVTLMTTLLSVTTSLHAGDLDPPGAPAPTPNLNEPRTPITAIPVTIESPGSYYLTRSFYSDANQPGIIIDADNVTVDLNGFVLDGTFFSLKGTTGIRATAREHIIVRNGTVRGWGEDGINLFSAQDILIEGIIAADNWDQGIRTGENSVITRCIARGNGGGGFETGNGCLVHQCSATGNPGGAGIGFDVGDQSRVSNCVARNNGSVGIRVGDGCTVSNCISASNGNDGISFGSACVISGNACDSNANSGIRTLTGGNSRIADNCVTSNGDRGIHIAPNAGGNIIVRNTASDNSTADYTFAAGNHSAQIIVTPGFGFVSSDPWANFSF